jgi:peptidoglycan/xylan/chitin deacetylase (PgdA/CDA1 family)
MNRREFIERIVVVGGLAAVQPWRLMQMLGASSWHDAQRTLLDWDLGAEAAVIPRNLLARAGTTIVSWASLTGWGAEGGGSALAAETTITPPYGGQAVKLSNSNAAGTGQASIYTAGPFDFSGDSTIVEVPVYVPTNHIGGSYAVLLGSGGAFTSNYTKSWNSAKTLKGWNLFRFTISEFSKTGTPNLSAIDSIRIKCIAPTGVVTYAVFGPITIKRAYRPWIMLSFDDGLQTVYTTAKPLLDERGLKATVFVVPSSLFGATTFSQVQLDAMYAAGWDISSHTYDHSRQQTGGLSSTQKQAAIVNGSAALASYPRSNKFLAWPGGEHDDESVQFASDAGILLGRTTQNDPFPLSGDGLYAAQRVPGWSFDNSVRSAAQAVTQMRLHINLQQSAIWYGHNVVTPAVLSTDISVAELTTILNEVVRLRDSNLASVGVVSEFYGCLQGQRRRRAA